MYRPIWFSAMLLMIGSSAMATNNDEGAAAVQAFKDYVAAVASLDAQRVAPHYHEPLMVVAAAGARALATRADIAAWLTPVFARLKERGYARSDWSEFQSKLLSNGVAVVSTQTVRYKTDGQQMEKVGFTYILRKTSEGWKVAVLIGHDPANVLRLD
jgi:ketosteroid isomerase-like protein